MVELEPWKSYICVLMYVTKCAQCLVGLDNRSLRNFIFYFVVLYYDGDLYLLFVITFLFIFFFQCTNPPSLYH